MVSSNSKALFFLALLHFAAASRESVKDSGLIMNYYDTWNSSRRPWRGCVLAWCPAQTSLSCLPDHNESMAVVLDRFAGIGINTPGVVALLGAHSVGRMHCVNLVHRLYPDIDPVLNPGHVQHMLHKCPDPIPDLKAVQNVRNDRGTPMKLENNYYQNILDNKGLLIVDYQLATDKRTRPFVTRMAYRVKSISSRNSARPSPSYQRTTLSPVQRERSESSAILLTGTIEYLWFQMSW